MATCPSKTPQLADAAWEVLSYAINTWSVLFTAVAIWRMGREEF